VRDFSIFMQLAVAGGAIFLVVIVTVVLDAIGEWRRR